MSLPYQLIDRQLLNDIIYFLCVWTPPLFCRELTVAARERNRNKKVWRASSRLCFVISNGAMASVDILYYIKNYGIHKHWRHYATQQPWQRRDISKTDGRPCAGRPAAQCTIEKESKKRNICCNTTLYTFTTAKKTKRKYLGRNHKTLFLGRKAKRSFFCAIERVARCCFTIAAIKPLARHIGLRERKKNWTWCNIGLHYGKV